jgi:hypothetical protein
MYHSIICHRKYLNAYGVTESTLQFISYYNYLRDESFSTAPYTEIYTSRYINVLMFFFVTCCVGRSP